MGTDIWPNDHILLTPRLNKYFAWAAGLEVGCFLVCTFVLYCYFLSLTHRSSPLEHFSVKVLVSAIGGIGALASIFLSKAMWVYWKRYDTSSEGTKRFWFYVMTVFLLLGSSAYYHLVYKQQVDDRRL